MRRRDIYIRVRVREATMGLENASAYIKAQMSTSDEFERSHARMPSNPIKTIEMAQYEQTVCGEGCDVFSNVARILLKRLSVVTHIVKRTIAC